MKKIVLTYGIIMGAIPVSVMIIGMLISPHSQGSLALGWILIFLSSLLIFFGIRNFREKYNNGIITFGKAFQVGILITLVGALTYTIVWEIMYFNFIHDVMDGYFAAEAEKLKLSGASQEEMDKSAEMWRVYKNNPLVNAAFTILEPLPVTVLVTLISSLILKRKTKKEIAA